MAIKQQTYNLQHRSLANRGRNDYHVVPGGNYQFGRTYTNKYSTPIYILGTEIPSGQTFSVYPGTGGGYIVNPRVTPPQYTQQRNTQASGKKVSAKTSTNFIGNIRQQLKEQLGDLNDVLNNPDNPGIPIAVDKPDGRLTDTRGSGRSGTGVATQPSYTPSPTDITDQAQLKARNDAMQRGWRSYNYNGQTYEFRDEEFNQAKRNWNNRNKAGYQAEGVLNTPAELTKPVPSVYQNWNNGSNNVPEIKIISGEQEGTTPTTQTALNKMINTTIQDISNQSANQRIHFNNLNWAGMNDEQRRNYLGLIDKAIDPTNNDWNLYTHDGQQVLNQSANSGFGNLTLSELYNKSPNEFNDYMTNFRGQKWDTATEEGAKTYQSMLDYYNKNRKRIDKTFRKEGIQDNSLSAYQRIYDIYSKSLPKYHYAKHGAKLISRKY